MILGAAPLCWLVLFLLAPITILLAWSLQPPGSSGPNLVAPSVVGYTEVLGEGAYGALFLKTILMSCTIAVLAVVLAFPIAYLLAFVAGPKRYILLGLAFVPSLVSYVLRIFAWRLILGEDGLLNKALQGLGITDGPLSGLLYNRWTVIIVLTYVWVPWAVLPLFVRLDAIDRALFEASADLGLPTLATVRRVILPLAVPGALTAFFLVFIPTMGDFATAAYVGGTDGRMVGNLIQSLMSNLDLSTGSVLAALVLAVAALTMLVAVRLIRIKDVTDVRI